MHSPSVKTLQNEEHKINNELQKMTKNEKLKSQITSLK